MAVGNPRVPPGFEPAVPAGFEPVAAVPPGFEPVAALAAPPKLVEVQPAMALGEALLPPVELPEIPAAPPAAAPAKPWAPPAPASMSGIESVETAGGPITVREYPGADPTLPPPPAVAGEKNAWKIHIPDYTPFQAAKAAGLGAAKLAVDLAELAPKAAVGAASFVQSAGLIPAYILENVGAGRPLSMGAFEKYLEEGYWHRTWDAMEAQSQARKELLEEQFGDIGPPVTVSFGEQGQLQVQPFEQIGMLFGPSAMVGLTRSKAIGKLIAGTPLERGLEALGRTKVGEALKGISEELPAFLAHPGVKAPPPEGTLAPDQLTLGTVKRPAWARFGHGEGIGYVGPGLVKAEETALWKEVAESAGAGFRFSAVLALPALPAQTSFEGMSEKAMETLTAGAMGALFGAGLHGSAAAYAGARRIAGEAMKLAVGGGLPRGAFPRRTLDVSEDVYRAQTVLNEAARQERLAAWAERNSVPVQTFDEWTKAGLGADIDAYNAAVARGDVMNPALPFDNPRYEAQVQELVDQARQAAGAIPAQREQWARDDERILKLAVEATATRQVLAGHIAQGTEHLDRVLEAVSTVRTAVEAAREEAGTYGMDRAVIYPERLTDREQRNAEAVSGRRDKFAWVERQEQQKSDVAADFQRDVEKARADPTHRVRPYEPVPNMEGGDFIVADHKAYLRDAAKTAEYDATGMAVVDRTPLLNRGEPGPLSAILVIADGGKATGTLYNGISIGGVVRHHARGEWNPADMNSPVNKVLARLAELGARRSPTDAWTIDGARMTKRRLPNEWDQGALAYAAGREEQLARLKLVEYLPGDSRAGTPLTADLIRQGQEDIRTGTFDSPEAYALIEAVRRLGGKARERHIRRAEEAERGRVPGRAGEGEPGGAADAAAGGRAPGVAGPGGGPGRGRGGGARGAESERLLARLTPSQRSVVEALFKFRRAAGVPQETITAEIEKLFDLHDDLVRAVPGVTKRLDLVFEGTSRQLAAFHERHQQLAGRLERVERELEAAAQVIDERGYGIDGWKLGEEVPSRWRRTVQGPEGPVELTPIIDGYLAEKYDTDTLLEIHRRVAALQQSRATTPPGEVVSTRTRMESLTEIARKTREAMGRVSDLALEEPPIDPVAMAWVARDLLSGRPESLGVRFREALANGILKVRQVLNPMAIEEETDMVLQLAGQLTKDPTSARAFYKAQGVDVKALDRAMKANDPDRVAAVLSAYQRQVSPDVFLHEAVTRNIRPGIFTSFAELYSDLAALETIVAPEVKEAITRGLQTKQERELASILIDEAGLENRLKRAVDARNRHREMSHGPPLTEAEIDAMRVQLYQKLRLSPSARAAVDYVRQALHDTWRLATSAGIINPRDFLYDFLPRQYGKRDAVAVMAHLEKMGVLDRPNAHSLHRVFETLLDAQEAGFKPKTLDVAELTADYVASIGRSVLKQQGIRDLMRVAPHQFRTVQLEGPLPAGWQELDGVYLGARNPQFNERTIVHEDLGRLLNNLLGPSFWRQGARGRVLDWNNWFKHAVLTLDIYHMKQLTQAVFAEGVLVSPERLRDSWRALVEELHPDHPVVAFLQRNGLGAYGGDYAPLRDFHNWWANHPAVKPLEWATKRFNEATWGHYVPAMKIMLGLELFQRQQLANPWARPEDIARGVASHINGVLGGRSFLETGRSKTFEDSMRLFLLAPDWVMSRFRLAIGGVKGAGKGLLGVTNELHPWRDRLHELDMDFWVNPDNQGGDGFKMVAGYLFQGMIFTAAWNSISAALFPELKKERRLDGLNYFFKMAIPQKDKWGRNLLVSFMPNVDYMVEAIEDTSRFISARTSPVAKAVYEGLWRRDFSGRSTGTLFGGENLLNLAANLFAPIPMPVNPAWQALRARPGLVGLELTRSLFRLGGFHSRTNYPFRLRDEEDALEAGKLRLERNRAMAGRVPGGNILFDLQVERHNQKVKEWIEEAKKEPDLYRHIQKDLRYRLWVQPMGRR